MICLYLSFTGKPPATGTSTLHIVLGDINDNKPHLVTKNTVLCSHKDKVPVMARDSDIAPYGGPFSFAFGGDKPEELKKVWKLFPTTGEYSGYIFCYYFKKKVLGPFHSLYCERNI